MPYAKDHFRFTFGGHQAGSEIWQCGMNFATPGSGALAWPTDGFDMAGLFLIVKTAFNNSNISAGASYEWVKVALVGTDGKYKHDPQDFHGTAVTGTVLTLASGPQDSVCVSLWSGSSLGKGNHGRFYLPWNGNNVDRTNGKIVSTLIPGIASAWVTAIHAIEASLVASTPLGPGLELFIMGPSGQAKVATHLRIGDVLDTQRRRRNALRETYFDANL